MRTGQNQLEFEDCGVNAVHPLERGSDEEGAKEYIHKSDDQRVRWARFVYGRNIRDPALYDLNINLGHLTIEEICVILEHILQEKDFQATDELKLQVEQLLLAANVEAALIIDARTQELEIEAKLENGCVHLTGPYLEDADLATVTEIAKAVDGIKSVEYHPGYSSQYRREEHEWNLDLDH